MISPIPSAASPGIGDSLRPTENTHQCQLPVAPLIAALNNLQNNFAKRTKASNADHITKEKLRRERIKESCDQLRVLLPCVKGRKTDMASILETCADYLTVVNEVLPKEFRDKVSETLEKYPIPRTPRNHGSVLRKRSPEHVLQPDSTLSSFPPSVHSSLNPTSTTAGDVESPASFRVQARAQKSLVTAAKVSKCSQQRTRHKSCDMPSPVSNTHSTYYDQELIDELLQQSNADVQNNNFQLPNSYKSSASATFPPPRTLPMTAFSSYYLPPILPTQNYGMSAASVGWNPSSPYPQLPVVYGGRFANGFNAIPRTLFPQYPQSSGLANPPSTTPRQPVDGIKSHFTDAPKVTSVSEQPQPVARDAAVDPENLYVDPNSILNYEDTYGPAKSELT